MQRDSDHVKGGRPSRIEYTVQDRPCAPADRFLRAEVKLSPIPPLQFTMPVVPPLPEVEDGARALGCCEESSRRA